MNLRQLRELGVTRIPNLHGIRIGIHDILQVRRQSRAIDGWSSALDTHSLSDIEDDAREAVFV